MANCIHIERQKVQAICKKGQPFHFQTLLMDDNRMVDTPAGKIKADVRW